MPDTDFDHYVITRFNVATSYGGGAPPDDDWLRHRIQLFETFTLPSVIGQTVEDFTWLVFFAPESPEFLSDAIGRWARCPRFNACVADGMDTGWVAGEAIRAEIDSRAGYIITTRLDNDDALCRTHLADVQAAFAAQECVFLNSRSGVLLDVERAVFKLASRSVNPFISCIERNQADLVTVMCADHEDVESQAPVVELDGECDWLQVQHGRNVSQRRGGLELGVHLLAPGALHDHFCVEWTAQGKAKE